MSNSKNIEKLEHEILELETIFELSMDEIFVTDGAGNCIRVNPACQKNCGKSVDELVGRNVRDLVAEGIFTPSATLKVLETKEPVTVIQTTSNGKRLHVTSSPVFNDSGELIFVISNTIDITEVLSLKEKIKEMEELIESYNIQLNELKSNNQYYGNKIVAKSPSIVKILELLGRVAKVDSTVLLLGESGVGKTEIARWIHDESTRKNASFVEINCGAIPPNLFESELYGYESGAFSGSLSSGKKGLIELADNGTLFLDEIGELSIDLQTKLLQVIQNKSFMRVGGRKTKKVDIRIIAATNRDLDKMVRDGAFRQDLYYRLSVVPIEVPPLRDRREELIELIFSLLDRINAKYNSNKMLSPNVLEELTAYDWPGNIRELENTLERLVVTTDGILIDKGLTNQPPAKNFKEEPKQDKAFYDKGDFVAELFNNNELSLEERLESVEKELLSYYMKKLGSTRKVADFLSSSQSTISRKCIKYKINRPKNDL
ncbi:PAS domain S-box-containing protein [Scopulibacillus darangshiensis]|uniref:HTH-type transcriptional regulatory protein TyrR n=1 Tax=Scopulibacillus darangshiensis TaxID=442528 RepID=A0A4R2NK34_9BACL|nr:sigma 54-interacting transcriptional regulator [Scopulibacillus darangshiensis]TCP21504.1 PAS domain S-box-containing protein [Scopulibacillus darangshiensis]